MKKLLLSAILVAMALPAWSQSRATREWYCQHYPTNPKCKLGGEWFTGIKMYPMVPMEMNQFVPTAPPGPARPFPSRPLIHIPRCWRWHEEFLTKTPGDMRIRRVCDVWY